MPASHSLTVRLSNLPQETKATDVRRFFDSRIGPTGTVVPSNGIGDIVTQVNRRTKQTTVTFKSRDLKKKALRDCDEVPFSSEYGNGFVMVKIDDDFDGLTTLYYPKSGEPNIDIVALHGLSGHPWDTFASSRDTREGIKESIWLRDELPAFLEQQENKDLRPRVMTFGYNANVWTNATIDGIDTPVADLVHSLKVERQQDPNRPLIFIGHSLGGIVIKQVVDFMITSAKQVDPNHVTPITACLFLAVPHRGTGNADSLNNFLSVINSILPHGIGPNMRFVKDLTRKNERLAAITDRFIQLLNGNKISIISCYENKDYAKGKGRIVSKESATLDFAGREELPRPIDANHADVARFGNASQHPFAEIANELAIIGHAAIKDWTSQFSHFNIGSPTQNPNNATTAGASSIYAEPRQPGVEPAFYMLTRYTTILLVDDSSSMEDIPELGLRPWTETTRALAECAKLVLGAGGRLKIHFFNSNKSKENISGVDELRALCQEVVPRGDTPTYSRLKRHLDEFIEAFTPLNVEQREAYPGLNLLVFTDGAPEGRFDDIEEVIVETAEDLDGFRPRVDKYKVGIQFVQIGDDAGVRAFFNRIDNEIKGERRLKRDIVDTTRYNPRTATEKTYKKIILGAIDKNWDEETGADTMASEHRSSQPRFSQYGQNEAVSPPHFPSPHASSQRVGASGQRQYTQ